MKRKLRLVGVFVFVLGGCSGNSDQPTPPSADSPPPLQLFVIGGPRGGGPIPTAELVDKARLARASLLSRPADHALYLAGPNDGAIAGAAVGALTGALIGNGRGALIGAAIGAGPLPASDRERLAELYDMLRSGHVPVSIWSLTQPPLRIRVLLRSAPPSAVLFIRGAPTAYQTNTDLLMSLDEIQASTLELPGYAPCRIAASLVPGLNQPDGHEIVTIECVLVARATTPIGAASFHSRELSQPRR